MVRFWKYLIPTVLLICIFGATILAVRQDALTIPPSIALSRNQPQSQKIIEFCSNINVAENAADYRGYPLGVVVSSPPCTSSYRVVYIGSLLINLLIIGSIIGLITYMYIKVFKTERKKI